MSGADPAITGKIPDGYRGFVPRVQPDAASLEDIAGQPATGKITSKVARVFRRGELLEALEINKAGDTTGRLIVDLQKA